MYSEGSGWTGGPEDRRTGGPISEAAEQRRGAAQRFRETELPLVKLWTYYYGIGGDIDEVSLDAYLNEALDLPAAEVGLITTAMTEMTEGDTE